MINKSTIFLSLAITTTFTACSHYKFGTYKNEYNQVCANENSKIHLHSLVNEVIKNTNSNMATLQMNVKTTDSYVTFKDTRCFSNIYDLKSYIDLYTNYTLEISKDKPSKSFKNSNDGILLNNVSIKDVFEYLNLAHNTKYKYYDDNIILKSAIKRLYTIEDLANYISKTTPFTLIYIMVDNETIYKLAYKDNSSKDDEVLNNLNRARDVIKDTNNSKTLNKIDNVIKEIKNFN